MPILAALPRRGVYWGYVLGSYEPHRDPKSAFYMPLDEWGEDEPPMAVVSGSGYALSNDLAMHVALEARKPTARYPFYPLREISLQFPLQFPLRFPLHFPIFTHSHFPFLTFPLPFHSSLAVPSLILGPPRPQIENGDDRLTESNRRGSGGSRT